MVDLGGASTLIGHAYADADPAKLHAAELIDVLDGFCAALLHYAEASE